MNNYYQAKKGSVKAKKKMLATRIYLAKNFFEQAHGLMFRTLHKNEVMYFPFNKERKIRIHMFCVFTALDIIYLNKKKIVYIEHKMQPFSISKQEYLCDAVLELPAGSAKTLKKGDVLEIIC